MTVTTSRTLIIDIGGYWHAGAGRSSGHYVDALCERDEAIFPVLPGRQLKGLLRHAVRRAEAWRWLHDLPLPEGPAARHEDLLFGTGSGQASRSATHPGILMVGSARLPASDRTWLVGSDQRDISQSLFGELFSTAINERGSALRHSLRGMEVAVPCQLRADLAQAGTALEPERRHQQLEYMRLGLAWEVLAAALPLLDHVGAHRSRGFGETVARLSATAGED